MNTSDFLNLLNKAEKFWFTEKYQQLICIEKHWKVMSKNIRNMYGKLFCKQWWVAVTKSDYRSFHWTYKSELLF